MKKWICVIAVIIYQCCLMAETPEKVAVLSSKVTLKNKNGYFVLSDGSCWKVVAFSKRWRSLSEWWHDVKLAPKTYKSLPDDWFIGTELEVYSKYDHLEADEENASNKKMLRRCTHLLVNSRTRQVLFAVELDLADCILQVFQDAYEEGYNKGYSKGKSSSDTNISESYDRGHREGYHLGLQDGYQKAWADRSS